MKRSVDSVHQIYKDINEDLQLYKKDLDKPGDELGAFAGLAPQEADEAMSGSESTADIIQKVQDEADSLLMARKESDPKVKAEVPELDRVRHELPPAGAFESPRLHPKVNEHGRYRGHSVPSFDMNSVPRAVHQTNSHRESRPSSLPLPDKNGAFVLFDSDGNTAAEGSNILTEKVTDPVSTGTVIFFA